VSKDLVEYMKKKVRALPYEFGKEGKRIHPQDIAYIYGQQEMLAHLVVLYQRSVSNESILNTEVPNPSG